MAVYLGSNKVCTRGGIKNVTGGVSLQSKTVDPSESSQTVTADSSYDGLLQVTVNAVSNTYVGSGITKKSATTYTPSTSNQTIASGTYLSGAQTIKGDSNLVASNIKSGVSIFGVSGSYTASSGSTTPTLQSKSISPSESSQTVTPDSGYDGLSQVTVNAISSTYVGSGVTKKSATTYTPTTSDQTISSGQYLNGAQTIKGDSNLIASNIKSGVTIFGVSGSYTASASSPNLQSKSVSPSESSQTVKPDSGYDGLSQVTVSAISTTYVGSGVTKKAAATYIPSTSDQTIANGQYLNGTQTIKGDSNLIAANIKSGVSIFGVAGSYTGSGSGGSSTNNCEAYHITSTSATINFQGSGTVKVFGYGAKKSTYTTTIYSFVGDGYYTGVSYGTPSKTTASFSVSGGTLKGLPSGLTAVDLLVVIGV